MDIQSLINDYMKWLKSEITFDKIGEYYEITLPYLDEANDYLQIYVRQKDGVVYFTDDGVAVHSLKLKGIQDSYIKSDLFQKKLAQYGVYLSGDELTTQSSLTNFAQKSICLYRHFLWLRTPLPLRTI